MSTNFPTISLCMIARDEEAMIGNAIQSVLPVVSEVIVVDTGSNDRTVEIAEALGAKVFHRPWDDDFSAPRNFSISNASSEWILVLDADEAIAASDLEKLRSLTLNRSICSEFLQRHYTNDVRLSGFTPCRGEYRDSEKSYAGYFTSNLCRLFPKLSGLEFRGLVHELVEHSIYERPELRIVRTDIPIHHYGHTTEIKSKKNKGGLYTPLGAQKTRETPNDWKAWFELGVSHNNEGRLQDSAMAFEESLRLNPNYIDTLINLGYVECELKRYQQAETSLNQALQINSESFEALCNLGVVYLRTRKASAAERYFREAIFYNADYVNAWSNLARALAFQKRISEAANILKLAIARFPRAPQLKVDIGTLYLQSGLPHIALPYLQQAADQLPSEYRPQYLLAQVFKQLSKTEDSVRALTKFCELAERVPSLSPEIEAALIDARNTVAAAQAVR